MSEVDALKARIKELEEGACRFNCRKQKDAWMAGWYRFAAQAKIMNSDQELQGAAEAAYKEWKNSTKA